MYNLQDPIAILSFKTLKHSICPIWLACGRHEMHHGAHPTQIAWIFVKVKDRARRIQPERTRGGSRARLENHVWHTDSILRAIDLLTAPEMDGTLHVALIETGEKEGEGEKKKEQKRRKKIENNRPRSRRLVIRTLLFLRNRDVSWEDASSCEEDVAPLTRLSLLIARHFVDLQP